MKQTFYVIFDGPPGPESGRFVECETNEGVGVRVGEWDQKDGYWRLGPFKEADETEQLLRAKVQHLVECGLTCSRANQTEWLEYWRDEMNAALDLIGEKDRVVLRRHDFAIERVKS